MKTKKTSANQITSDRPSLKYIASFYQIGDRIAYAYNNELTFGFILRFEPAPDGTLIVVTQDRFLNHMGRPIYRRPDQILAVEE